MKVQIRFTGFEGTQALTDFATDKVQQHLGRFGHQVGAVLVRLSDVNGPRGGSDKRCRFEVTGPSIGKINVEGQHEDAYAGVDLTLDRLTHTIGRNLERLRRHPFQRRPSWG